MRSRVLPGAHQTRQSALAAVRKVARDHNRVEDVQLDHLPFGEGADDQEEEEERMAGALSPDARGALTA